MPATRRDLRTLPVLEGWLTFPEAAAELGISRQRLHQLAEIVHEDGTPELVTASRIGDRPVYVIREAEVRARKNRKHSPAAPAVPVAAFPDHDSLTFSVVGGTAVSDAQLREAVQVLEETACSRGSFKQALARTGNPLASSDYMATARAWRLAHPEDRMLGTKQLLLAVYRGLLAEVPVAV